MRIRDKVPCPTKRIEQWLVSIKDTIFNQDILSSAINAFPRMTQWVSMVDFFYMLKDFEVSTLDFFFYHGITRFIIASLTQKEENY